LLAVISFTILSAVPAKASPEVTAVVRDVLVAPTSVPRVRVVVSFSNGLNRSVVIDQYEVTWPGGRRVISKASLRLDANGSAVRSCDLDLVTSSPPRREQFRVAVVATHDVGP
jgi:hypothetical protein